eukprot:g50015.t1
MWSSYIHPHYHHVRTTNVSIINHPQLVQAIQLGAKFHLAGGPIKSFKWRPPFNKPLLYHLQHQHFLTQLSNKFHITNTTFNPWLTAVVNELVYQLQQLPNTNLTISLSPAAKQHLKWSTNTSSSPSQSL